ncbi:glycosyltransferase, partial [Escherichia coli]|uniref:glycosyltransferase n=1 Tax=Escherichia coli TaxID=562 RepID=UPI001EDB2780
MKHIVVTIRYSLLMENNLRKSWKVGLDNDFESYKKILFDSSRLSVREKIFNKICLPSLIKINNSITSDISFKVHILT